MRINIGLSDTAGSSLKSPCRKMTQPWPLPSPLGRTLFTILEVWETKSLSSVYGNIGFHYTKPLMSCTRSNHEAVFH